MRETGKVASYCPVRCVILLSYYVMRLVAPGVEFPIGENLKNNIVIQYFDHVHLSLYRKHRSLSFYLIYMEPRRVPQGVMTAQLSAADPWIARAKASRDNTNYYGKLTL